MSAIEMSEIRRRIRATRVSRGWSLADFQERSGGAITAVAMGSYERGGRTLSAPKLLAICAIFEISLVHLLQSDHELVPGEISGRHIYDLRRLQELTEGAEKNQLLAYIHQIIRERGDWKGEVISLRKNDIENLIRIFAASNSLKSCDYLNWSGAQGILLKKN
jgi:transcriptional regulator with XRE-family HTH domain